jgi:hypothetical protein
MLQNQGVEAVIYPPQMVRRHTSAAETSLGAVRKITRIRPVSFFRIEIKRENEEAQCA